MFTRVNGYHQNTVCHHWFLFVFVIIIRTHGSRHAHKHIRANAQTASRFHERKHRFAFINRDLRVNLQGVGGVPPQRTRNCQASPVSAPQTKVPKCRNLFTSLCIWGCIRRQGGRGVRTDRLSTWMKLSCCVDGRQGSWRHTLCTKICCVCPLCMRVRFCVCPYCVCSVFLLPPIQPQTYPALWNWM